jgi:hypothetical protein
MQQSSDQVYSLVTQEEQVAVIEKLQHLVQLPAGHMPRQDELYLEQQLSEILGFEVSAENEDVRLPHSIGVMVGLPHLRRHVTDALENHDSYREAGIAERRSRFGWFTEMGQLTPAAILREKYYISIQAELLPEWAEKRAEFKEWLKYRKMIVVNPFAKKAIVVAIGDIGPANWLQEQFGGSPEVIREAEVWSLPSQGRVLLLFVHDLEDRVKLGPIDLP